MLAYLVATLILFFAMGSSHTYVMEPESLYDWGLIDAPPLSCRPLTNVEQSTKGYSPRGKATTFNLEPMALCEKPIFPYGDRDSFYDFVIQYGPSGARRVSGRLPALENRLKEHGWLPDGGFVWNLEILSASPEVQKYSEMLFRVELANATTGSINFLPGHPVNPARIKVHIQNTMIPEDLFRVEVEVLSQGERRLWTL